jgi:hypothetical protein
MSQPFYVPQDQKTETVQKNLGDLMAQILYERYEALLHALNGTDAEFETELKVISHLVQLRSRDSLRSLRGTLSDVPTLPVPALIPTIPSAPRCPQL